MSNISLKHWKDKEEKSESMRYIWVTDHRSTPLLMEIFLGLPSEAQSSRSHWKSNMQGMVHMKVFMGPYSVPHSLFHSPLPSNFPVLSSLRLCKFCGFGKLVQRSLQFLLCGERLLQNRVAIMIIIISPDRAMISNDAACHGFSILAWCMIYSCLASV